MAENNIVNKEVEIKGEQLDLSEIQREIDMFLD